MQNPPNNITMIQDHRFLGGAARAANRWSDFLETEGFTIQRMAGDQPEGKGLVLTGKPPRGWARLYEHFTDRRSARKTKVDQCLENMLQKEKPDLIWFHNIAGGGKWGWSEDMISIARQHAPVLWTMHDMWAFCGAEHYSSDNRWRDGYNKNNRPVHESGLDINKIIWLKKRSTWKKSFHMIGNCSWISHCARSSSLMKGWSTYTIPNAINTDVWAPFDKTVARQLLGLPLNTSICMFSSLGLVDDKRKGFDLLLRAINYLSKSNLRGRLEFVALTRKPENIPAFLKDLKFKFHFIGPFSDDVSLRLAYSASDVVAIPSRQETLTNVGVEAHSCGIPVVAFNVCGLTDIVDNHNTGYLADPFDPEDFGKGIHSLLDLDSVYFRNYQIEARRRALKLWSNSVVSSQLKSLYATLVSSQLSK